MKSIWKIISSLFIVLLTVEAAKWYIKGHRGKYAVAFFIVTILSLMFCVLIKIDKPKHDPTPGYVYWERNVKGH